MTSPASVLFLDHCALLSGGEVALVRLLEALGPAVSARVELGEHGPLEELLRLTGATVNVVPLPSVLSGVRRDDVRAGRLSWAAQAAGVRYVWSLSRRLRADRPDVVHTNSLKAALYGGVAGRLAGVPVVWHLRDRIADDYLPRPAVVLVRLLARALPSAVLANSRTTLTTVGVRGGQVLADVYAPPPLPPRPVDRPVFVVGVVGRLTSWKGQDVVVRAFARAFRGEAAELRLVGSAMFGEQDYESGLRRLVRELGVEDQVRFLGFCDDVPSVLADLDVLVHASTVPEPHGQVVVEGLAAGLAVVASSEGGPAEVVTDGVDGLLVAPRQPELLAAALRRLRDEPGLRERLGRQAPAAVVRFAPETAVRDLLPVYAALLSRRGGRRRGR